MYNRSSNRFTESLSARDAWAPHMTRVVALQRQRYSERVAKRMLLSHFMLYAKFSAVLVALLQPCFWAKDGALFRISLFFRIEKELALFVLPCSPQLAARLLLCRPPSPPPCSLTSVQFGSFAPCFYTPVIRMSKRPATDAPAAASDAKKLNLASSTSAGK
jgi:hypothetical protein